MEDFRAFYVQSTRIFFLYIGPRSRVLEYLYFVENYG